METQNYWFQHTPSPAHEVVVIGDSRIGEGFSALAATKAAGGKFHFDNLGVAGSTPRVWYYMIRDADPGRNRLDALVLQLPQYSDQDLLESAQDRAGDTNFVIGRLRLTDCYEFSRSFLDRKLRRNALSGCFFRGIPLRADIADLFTNFVDRVKRANDWRLHGRGYIDGYGGKPENVEGISADFEKRTLNFPPGLKDWQTNSIRSTVFPEPADQNGHLTAYRQQWMGRVLDYYRGSKTRVVFVETPRAPLPIPEAKTPPRFLNSALQRPNVRAFPAATFRDLERPELFADGLHLNRDGRAIFSERLGQRLAAVLGAQ